MKPISMNQTNAQIDKGKFRVTIPLLGLALLLGMLSACGSSDVEKGALPQSTSEGAVVALAYDAAKGRLLKAYPHALSQSTDGGGTWQPVPLPASARQGQITAVASPADSSGVIYIAGPKFGVMRTEDEGRRWIRRSRDLPEQGVRAFATHATQAGTLYASIPERGIFRSEDGGARWKLMDGGPGAPIDHLFHSDMPGSMQTGWLFAATPEGVWRSMDCFCGWRPAGTLPDAITSVAYDPEEPKRVYAATVTGVFRSSDGGENWEPISTPAARTGALAVDRSGTLYLAVSEGALLRSLNQGQSWEQVGA